MKQIGEYTIFKIPKRNGKFRTIESPSDTLKATQKKNLAKLVKILKVSPFAHAFQPYKNITTMAMGHVGKEYVGCMDVKDFFPSITKENFLGVLRTIDKTKQDVMAKVEKLIEPLFFDFGDGKGSRLPQGAPSSPFLSNVFLFTFDWRMTWQCHRLGYDYSRYADDLVISGAEKRHIHALFQMSLDILAKHYKLAINPPKTKFMHKSQRQLVCGVVVNEKLNLPRRWRKNLRAEVHQAKGALSLETKGRMSFAEMVRNTKKTSHSSMQIANSVILSRQLERSMR